MGTRNAIAIDLGRRRLRAVQASASHSRLRVRGVVVEDVPADLNMEDVAAVGAWLAEKLQQAGMRGGAATLSVGREHVGVKRITLPTADPVELPDMTRLAMQRELPFDADSAVIDFVPVEQQETSTSVLAVAVPRKQIEFLRQVAEAAGLKVQRIALRTMGAAALMMNDREGIKASRHQGIKEGEDNGGSTDQSANDESLDASMPRSVDASDQSSIVNRQSSMHNAPAVLGVDVVGEGVEFCVVSEGSIRFSRAAEVPAPQDELAMADAVVTEARRTWMSYRSGEEAGGISEAVIMGDMRVAEYAAGPVGEMLKMPVRVLKEHPRIDAAGHDLSRVWPLAGLLLESETAGENEGRIDFLHPRRAPDVGARTRQRRLLAAAAFVIVGGAAYTLMRGDLQRLHNRADSLAKQREAGAAGYTRAYRDTYKLEHLKQWSAVHVDWLDHAMFLARVAPPPEKVVLDSWTGTLDFRGVTFDRTTGRWGADHEATIVIDGEARDRATADAFRGVLLKEPIYTASTTGADAKGGKRMPFGFTYRLRTRAAAPEESSGAAVTPVNDKSGRSDIAKRQAVGENAATNQAQAAASTDVSPRPAPQQ